MKFAEFYPGQLIEAGPYAVDETEIIEFARQYDPQWFHTDPLQSAGASRFHHQLPQADIITYSPTVPLPDETISQLSELGYRTIPHPYDYGDVQTIYRDGDEWLAASDPRKRGESRVVEIADGD